MSGSLLVAIDGPSGSGKSTAAKGVARRLGVAYLDTGAMYRAVAWEFLRSGLADDDADGVLRLAVTSDLRVATSHDEALVTMNGEDVTAAIREPRIAEKVSVVATNRAVRDHLTRRMREVIAAHGRRIVVEGRDITTVVAPDADVRVLLVADPDARVARRKADLGEKVDVAAVTDQVIRRDRDDATVSNFHEAADGVVVVDSTYLSPDEVVDRIVGLLP